MNLAELKQALELVLKDVAGETGLDLDKFSVSVAADPDFGDFASNAAMVYAKELRIAPKELAEKITSRLSADLKSAVAIVEVAGPGFINIKLSDVALAENVQQAPTYRPTDYEDKVVVAEYSDPNPFKILHVGHLYTSVVGDALANLVQNAGGNVHRVNFGGDVGLHVARNMWAIIRELGGEKARGLEQVKKGERARWLSARYVEGNHAYETDEIAKNQIIELNKKLYHIHDIKDHDSPLARIYWTCRQWSYDYFKQFYARIGVEFERYYPESEVSPLGVEKVHELLAKGVLEESDGAIVFRGEEFGLHTRVFLTSQGLPTYEAKDLGLLVAKWRDYKFDSSIVITASDIKDYMRVVLKVAEHFNSMLAQRSTHITHGNVKLAGGVKMSSRLGNFITAEDVLKEAEVASRKVTGKADERAVLGAIKYAFLKQRIGPDVVFVPEESVSLEGNSGPYLQYAHARARSIISKAKIDDAALRISKFEPAERLLARAIAQYPNVVQQAVSELLPHYLCGYLYDLAQEFNRFYEHNRVIGDERERQRLALVQAYADVLKNGLELLGIDAPDHL